MSKPAEESWRELAEAVETLKAELRTHVWELLLYVGLVWVALGLSYIAFGDWVSPLVPEWLCEECQP